MSLAAAYRATRYVVLEGRTAIVARIGRPCPALDRLLARRGAAEGGFVTAWNPRSALRPEPANRAAQRRLAAELDRQGLAWLPHLGIGEDGAWPPEAGAFVLAIGAERLLALAEAHGQNAVVLARLGAAPRLAATRWMPDAGPDLDPSVAPARRAPTAPHG